MTSYEFEVAAKNAVAEVLWDRFHEDYDISRIQVVWFAHTLGNKKAILIDNGQNRRMYEVTYNAQKHELYVDVYDKLINVKLDRIDTDAHLPSRG